MRSTVAASVDASARDRNSVLVATPAGEGRIRAAARAGLRRIKDAARWLVDTVGGVGSKLLAFARKVKGGVSRRSSRAIAAHLRLPRVPQDHAHETTAPHPHATSIEPPHAPSAVTVTTVDANPTPPRVDRREHEAPGCAPENAPREKEPVHEHAAKPDAAKLDATSEPPRPTTKRVRIIGPAEGWPFILHVAEDVMVGPAHVKFELGADASETWPFRMPGFGVNLAGAVVEDVF
ncbi:MAG: hypothetical protein U0441_20305 [Polyangiaceae bacterium]